MAAQKYKISKQQSVPPLLHFYSHTPDDHTLNIKHRLFAIQSSTQRDKFDMMA